MPHGVAKLVRMSPEIHRASSRRAKQLGVTFARYIRDLIVRDCKLDAETAPARGVGAEPKES